MRNRTHVDEYKLKLLWAMGRAQKRASMDKWFTITEARKLAEIGHVRAHEALMQMAAEGWLHIRHLEDKPEQLVYRVRSEYLP